VKRFTLKRRIPDIYLTQIVYGWIVYLRIRKELSRQLSLIKGAERFLNNDHEPEWISIEEFVEGIRRVGYNMEKELR